MNKKRFRGLALLLSLVMMLGLVPVTGMATSTPVNPITVTWYTDNNFTTLSSAKASQTYSSLYDAFFDISTGEFATVAISSGYRGDTTPINMNQGAVVRLSSGSATNVYGGNIVINNSAADLRITNLTIDATGTAVDVRSGTLFINSGTTITGSTIGVYNRAGTVQFGGGSVSSYTTGSNAITLGTPSYTSTPSPTPSLVAVTGVSVSPSSVALRVGGTQQLTATVTPSNATNKNVTWWSSDTSVVTVSSSGLVRAVGTGWANVRATTADGSYTALVDIQVNSGSSSVAVTGVTISGGSSVAVGSSITLTASVRPSNATNRSVSWSSSNSSVATVTSAGVVRGLKAGSATIRATTADGGYTASRTITVTEAAPAAAVSTDIARNTKLYLNGSSAGGKVGRSTSFVQLRPNGSNAVQENRMSVLVRAFNRLPEDGYSTLRYRLPWIYVDMGTSMTRGMENTDRIEVTVERLNYSYGTMSSTMNTKWRSYSNKNISGPWEVDSNSDVAGMTLRILLPEQIAKSKIRVLSWNGSSFVSMNTNRYAVVRIGTQYFVRISNAAAGVYAVVER